MDEVVMADAAVVAANVYVSLKAGDACNACGACEKATAGVAAVVAS
jgi:hypothetical protein